MTRRLVRRRSCRFDSRPDADDRASPPHFPIQVNGLVRILLSVLSLAAVASVAPAQQPSDTTRLAPVLITASRTSTVLNAATTATTVLQGDALRARGIATVGDALRQVPGATLAQTSGPGSQTSLFLRGGETDYVQVMIDGVTVNEPGGALNFANLSLDAVERIEIVRGPTSVLYGANAVTGVIQIFTRAGAGRTEAEVRARAGQRGLLDVEASAGGDGRRVGYWVGGGHHAFDGIYDLNNDTRNTTATGRLRLKPSSPVIVDVTGRYADARFDYPTEYYGAPLDSNSYSTERRLSGGVNVVYAIRPAIDLRLVAGTSRLQNITNDPVDDRIAGFDDGSPMPFESRSLRRNADAQLDLRIIPDATLTLGGEYDWQRLETGGEDTRTDPLLDRWSRGAFAQLLGNLGSRLAYTMGGRLEDNERYGTLNSVRIGAGMAVAPLTTLRASAGTAFKEPQFVEITGAGFALPNPTLRPERSRSWEVGVEQRFATDAVALAVTYFDQAFTQMIIYAPIPATGGFSAQYINAQSANSRGWELEARASLPGKVTARANYTLLDADVRATASGAATPLLRRASRTGSLVLSVPVTSRLLLTSDASHVGPRPDIRFLPADPFSQDVELPPYTLIGIGGTYSIPPLVKRTELELLARVDNLADERYEAVAGFATPRRTASIGMRIRLRP